MNSLVGTTGTTNIDNIKSAVNSLLGTTATTNIDNITNAVDTLVGTTATTNIDNIKSAVDSLSNISTTTSNINKITNAVDNLNNPDSDISKSITNIKDAVDNVTSGDASVKIDRIIEKTGNLDETITTNLTTFTDIISKASQLSSDIGTFTPEITSVISNIGTATSAVESVIDAAENIKDAINVINATIKDTTTAASNIAQAVSSLNAKKVSKILDPILVKLGASLSDVLDNSLKSALAPILGTSQSSVLGPTMNLGQSKARTPYDLGTGLTPCSPNQIKPNLSRADTNYQCITTKKNNILTARVKIGNIYYILPCPIIKHLDELKLLLTSYSMKNAIFIIAEKYNIDLQQKPVTNVKRYIYPTVNSKKVIPNKQFNTSYRLTNTVSGIDISINSNYILKKEDAKFLAIANDDTITLSYFYSDMIINATYWASLLPSFTSPIYCIIRPMLGKITQLVSGILELRNNTIIFTPYINKYLMFLYKNMENNTNINIIYVTKDFSEIIDYLSQVFSIIN